MRLARTPPEPPPIVNRSKSYFRLLEVGEIDLHQLKLRRERLVLGLVGEPLEGVPYAALDLRARHPLDADEHRRQVGEVARLPLPAHLGEPRFDRAAIEVGHQLQRLVVLAHRAILPVRGILASRRGFYSRESPVLP